MNRWMKAVNLLKVTRTRTKADLKIVQHKRSLPSLWQTMGPIHEQREVHWEMRKHLATLT